LRGLASPIVGAIRYRPVEVEPARLAAVRERLAALQLEGLLVDEEPPLGGEAGAVIANEVLDALPVHRVIGRPETPDGIAELLVGLDDATFVAREAPPTTADLGARLAAEGVTLANGQVTEVCLALDGWLAGATRHLRTGVVILIDYGVEPAAVHDPERRPTGTLRAFAAHAVGADPFRHVGRQDLTATVDLAAVRAAASRAGLEPLGETTQAELVAALGTGELTQGYLRRGGAGLQDALELRSGLARLLDPRGMGAFRVLAFGRGMPPGTRLAGLERLVPGSG
jgi:SAM-dependent MidA family methyltransferase